MSVSRLGDGTDNTDPTGRAACLVGLTADGYVATWSVGAQRMLGYTPDEAVGQHLSFVCTVEDQRLGLPESHLREAREQETSHHVGWRVRQDGSRFWSACDLVTRRSRADVLLGFVQLVRELPGGLRSDPGGDTFHTAFMDHFRDTLAVVRGFSELSSVAEADDRRYYLSRVDTCALRLEAMTEGLVLRSPEAGNGSLPQPGPT